MGGSEKEKEREKEVREGGGREVGEEANREGKGKTKANTQH